MKRFSVMLMLFAFCLTISAQTVDEIVEKNIAAHGGLEKIKAVKSMMITGKSLLQGIEVPTVIKIKRPNMVRLEMSLQGNEIVQAYDGTTGWQIMPFMGTKEPQKLSAEELESIKDQADIDGELVDYKEKGHKVELVGKEELDGSPVYKLKLTKKSGETSYIYIDAESHLEIKQTSSQSFQGNKLEVDSYFSDYKEVNGLVLPHAIEQKVGGNTMMQMKVNKYELNVDLSDSIFKMPTGK
ncbi:MAG: outer membrane lipoprotein-sorting protein [Acidobacteriota bacterium]|nr:outer membrane lipoprotein-sorting protein [Blastocatellia bacterium]MDW8411049.1 outer membrane lipoprotein-sorting protein [Acidobacteriota bacterium]